MYDIHRRGKHMMLTRDKHKEIKHMDRQELENFLENLCGESFNSGVTTMSHAVVDVIQRGINNTKGVGEKRGRELMDNINNEMLKGADKNEY